MKTKKFNDEVLYPDDEIVTVRRGDIESMKILSQKNARKRIRLCAHQTVDDPVHEMLIIHARDTYVRPHKHLNKTESFHVVEGSLQVVVFDDSQNILEVILMGDYASGRVFYYRLGGVYHTILLESDFVVFHETSKGPFNRAETVFAPWSPEESNPDEARKFMEGLRQKASALIKSRS